MLNIDQSYWMYGMALLFVFISIDKTRYIFILISVKNHNDSNIVEDSYESSWLMKTTVGLSIGSVMFSRMHW